MDTFDVFCSYNSQDHVFVQAVAEALRQRGRSVFLDRWYLVPGRPWPQALEDVLRRCRSAAVFLGPHGMGRWQQSEAYLALDRQRCEPSFPVVPVLLPGADPALGFLSLNTWVDLRSSVSDPIGLAVMDAAVRGEPPGPDVKRSVAATLASVCPYRGLRPFREEDAPFFFGRDKFISHLVRAVESHSFVAVVGASGSGKSSVVRAGLVPQLRKQKNPVWDVITLVPNDRPFHAMAAALLPLLEPELSELDRLIEIGKTAKHIGNGELTLRDLVVRVLEKQAGTNRLLLVADQWEEVYTLCDDESVRRHFVDQLIEACNTAPLSIVLTLRGDFYGRALEYRPLADRIGAALVSVPSMSRDELRLAVEEPAKRVAMTFEPGLVDRVLDDVDKEPGNLPLLEFALTQLWEDRSGPQILHKSYEHMGEVQGAIARRAEAVYARLTLPDQEMVRDVFVQLVRPGEGSEDTRRRATFSELGDAASAIVRSLADNRLVVTGRDETMQEDTVEVAHEALIQRWDRLRGWMNEGRAFRAWQERLRIAMKQWKDKQCDEDALLRGALLAEAEQWMAARRVQVGQNERKFIQASASVKDRRRKRMVVLSAVVAVVMTALAVISSVAFFVVPQTNSRLKNSLVQDFLDQLSVAGKMNEEGRHDQALLWYFRSYQTAEVAGRTDLSASSRHLIGAWGRDVGRVLPHDGPVRAVAFSPDGLTVLTGSEDRTARLWDARNAQPRSAPLQHEGQVIAVAFSRDGKVVLTGGGESDPALGEARLWDARTGEPRRGILKHVGPVIAVKFSPDGQSVFTVSKEEREGTLRVWDASTVEPRGEPRKHGGMTAVAFDKDGAMLLTGSDDKTARLWDPWTSEQFTELKNPRGEVWAVALDPNGRLAATGNGDTTARLWDTRTGRQRGEDLKHEGLVQAVAFSPDGRTLATASWESLRFWDTQTGDPRSEPLKHGRAEDLVLAMAFSPDGSSVLTGCADKTARLWSAPFGEPLAEPLKHDGEVAAVAFSPNGETVLTGSTDDMARLWRVRGYKRHSVPLERNRDIDVMAFSLKGELAATASKETAQIWDLGTGKPRGNPLKHKDRITSVAFSADGETVITGSQDKTARLWNSHTGEPRGTAFNHENSVEAVGLSPNGRTLVTGSSDGTARRWDVRTGQPHGALLNHEESVDAVMFSPDGQTLLTGSSDGTARLWDARTGQARSEPLKHCGPVKSVAFSPDGHTVLIGSGERYGEEGEARLWDVRTGNPRGERLGQEGVMFCGCFSPDGRTVLIGSEQSAVGKGTARLWDVSTGQPCGDFLERAHSVIAVAFSEDGRTAMIGNTTHGVSFWDAPLPALDEPERLQLSVEVRTRLYFNERGNLAPLTLTDWEKRRQRLDELDGFCDVMERPAP